MSARVVIVGGGFAGAATAYWLARAGIRDVVIAEREAVCGSHASGRNAALGRQLTENRRFTELAIRGATLLRKPPPELAEQPLISDSGSLLLSGRAETLQRLVENACALRLPCAVLAPEAIVERWPLLEGTPLIGGVFFPTDGVIDIHALLTGLLDGARRGGVRLETRCEMLGFVPRPDGVVVETTAGAIEATCAVVAAGAWAGTVGARAAARMTFEQRRRHLHLTEPLPDVPPDAPFVWHLDDEFYARPESGALLVSACDETAVAPDQEGVSGGAVVDLAEKLARMAPRLLEYGVARSWACLRTFARHRRAPLIGWDPDIPWLFWVAGLGGHGATCSTAAGQDAAAAMLHRL